MGPHRRQMWARGEQPHTVPISLGTSELPGDTLEGLTYKMSPAELGAPKSRCHVCQEDAQVLQVCLARLCWGSWGDSCPQTSEIVAGQAANTQQQLARNNPQRNIVILSRTRSFIISFSLNSVPIFLSVFWGSAFWFHHGDREVISTALSSGLTATEQNLFVMWLHCTGIQFRSVKFLLLLLNSVCAMSWKVKAWLSQE